MGTAKVPLGVPNLELYALAEARYEELETHPDCRGCKECPGPEAPGSRCHQWRAGAPALKRRDWPFCPVGHTKVRTFRTLVERVVAAKLTPISGWPDEYLAGAYHAGVALHVALRKEEERRLEEKRGTRRSGSGAPFKARLQRGRR